MAVAFVKNHTVAFNKTAGTTLALALDTAVPAGNLIVCPMVYDNASTASKPLIASIGVAAGETASWTLTGLNINSTSTTAGSFASGGMRAILTTVQWPAGSYTVTLDTSTVQKAGAFQEFSGVTTGSTGVLGTNYSTTTTAASSSAAGGSAVAGDLFFGFIFGSNVATAQAGDTDTLNGSWSTPFGIGSTGGNVTTNNFGVAQYKIVTGGGSQTFNNSAAMTAGNGVLIVALKQYVPPAITQAAYGFYNDGTETGATALATQDTAHSADVTAGDVNLQLRTRLQSTTAVAVPATDDWQLQWERNTSGTWTDVSSVSVADGYDETNWAGSSGDSVTTAGQGVGQSFLGNGGKLSRADLWLWRNGTSSANITAQLFAHTGTYGTTGGVATGAALATSTPKLLSSLGSTSSGARWETFDFDGTLTLAAGTSYVLYLTTDTTDGVNYGNWGVDGSSPSHPGTRQAFNGTAWTSSTTTDKIFRVYTPAGTIFPYASPNLTDGAATTNRLGAGSGSFVAGKVSEDGLVDDLGWTANNHTELLYSVTLKQADLANGDTLRFRVLRNGATTGMTYTQTPTINVISAAPTDVAYWGMRL